MALQELPRDMGPVVFVGGIEEHEAHRHAWFLRSWHSELYTDISAKPTAARRNKDAGLVSGSASPFRPMAAMIASTREGKFSRLTSFLVT